MMTTLMIDYARLPPRTPLVEGTASDLREGLREWLHMPAERLTAMHEQCRKTAVAEYALEIQATLPRSPRAAPGRTGKIGPREVSIGMLMKESTDTADLFSRFRLKVAV